MRWKEIGGGGERRRAGKAETKEQENFTDLDDLVPSSGNNDRVSRTFKGLHENVSQAV